MNRFRNEAADVEIFPRVENDPMLEFAAGGLVLLGLERTGPYETHPGPGRLLVTAVTDAVSSGGEPGPHLEALGLSRIRARGMITRVHEPHVVVDIGFPFVLGVRDFSALHEGEVIEFDTEAPLHVFNIAESRRQLHGDEV